MKKKRISSKYNQRVMDIEKSSFNTLVFTTTGGMTPECNRQNKKTGRKKIAEKRRESYASLMTYVRTKLRFRLVACKGRSSINSGAWLRRFNDVTGVEKSCVAKAEKRQG